MGLLAFLSIIVNRNGSDVGRYNDMHTDFCLIRGRLILVFIFHRCHEVENNAIGIYLLHSPTSTTIAERSFANFFGRLLLMVFRHCLPIQ
jgi:hypothetical protein